MAQKYETPQGPPPGYIASPPPAMHYDDPRGMEMGGYGSPAPPGHPYGPPSRRPLRILTRTLWPRPLWSADATPGSLRPTAPGPADVLPAAAPRGAVWRSAAAWWILR
ncbi:hypothetical protein KC328_g7369 [Hortaea werneckii]|nr:hypothetical protein KC328_g7369 [Hortaea werneckii]